MHLELVENSDMNISIRDPKRFHHPTLRFHYQRISIHDESGHYFTVDETFSEKLEDLKQALKKN